MFKDQGQTAGPSFTKGRKYCRRRRRKRRLSAEIYVSVGSGLIKAVSRVVNVEFLVTYDWSFFNIIYLNQRDYTGYILKLINFISFFMFQVRLIKFKRQIPGFVTNIRVLFGTSCQLLTLIICIVYQLYIRGVIKKFVD